MHDDLAIDYAGGDLSDDPLLGISVSNNDHLLAPDNLFTRSLGIRKKLDNATLMESVAERQARNRYQQTFGTDHRLVEVPWQLKKKLAEEALLKEANKKKKPRLNPTLRRIIEKAALYEKAEDGDKDSLLLAAIKKELLDAGVEGLLVEPDEEEEDSLGKETASQEIVVENTNMVPGIAGLVMPGTGVAVPTDDTKPKSRFSGIGSNVIQGFRMKMPTFWSKPAPQKEDKK